MIVAAPVSVVIAAASVLAARLRRHEGGAQRRNNRSARKPLEIQEGVRRRTARRPGPRAGLAAAAGADRASAARLRTRNSRRRSACTFVITELGGTAPKFDCLLENGDRIRVKYGRTPEIPSEVAAARLLHALGFGADDVMLVEKLRCYGCPAEPFVTMRSLGLVGAEELYSKIMNTASLQGLRVGRRRAKALGPADRNRRARRLGVLRARSDRSEEGRRAAGARRLPAAARRADGALGQQEREPAAGVPVTGRLAGGRQVRAAARDAAGHRLARSARARSISRSGRRPRSGAIAPLHGDDGRPAVSTAPRSSR